jgi:glutaminyl-peptide cyclotransferase
MIALPLLILLTACRTKTDASGQDTVEHKAPPFSGDSAFGLLKAQVAFGPRVPGTEAHQKQLDWMLQYLRSRADTVSEQPFTYTTTAGKQLQLANVFARFNPAAPDRVLLLAHWDTRPTADMENDPARRNTPISGANDGASGVALLLELANVMAKQKPPIGVDILLVDGEDYAPDNMYLGANHFAANLPPGYKPLYGILLDMIGDQNPSYPVEPNSKDFAPEVVDRVWRTAAELGYGNYFPNSAGAGVEDDHFALNHAGIRTIDLIDFDYGPNNAYWHTLGDTVEHTSPVGLGVVGSVLLELIYRGG